MSAAVAHIPFVNSLQSQRRVVAITIATAPLGTIDVRTCRNKLNSKNDRHRAACNINQDVTAAACDICKLDRGLLD